MMSEKNIAEAKGSFLKRVAVDHEVNVFDRAVHGKINFSLCDSVLMRACLQASQFVVIITNNSRRTTRS